GAHAEGRYRCFLPDLAGFTSPRCPDHKPALRPYQQRLRRGWDSNPRYALTYTRFPSVRLQPLGHLSNGERRIRTYGTVPGTPDFESGAFDRSASSPAIRLSHASPAARGRTPSATPRSPPPAAPPPPPPGGCAGRPAPGHRANPPRPPSGRARRTPAGSPATAPARRRTSRTAPASRRA